MDRLDLGREPETPTEECVTAYPFDYIIPGRFKKNACARLPMLENCLELPLKTSLVSGGVFGRELGLQLGLPPESTL